MLFLLCLEKYDYVGRLLKPGESHSYYTDEEGSPTNKLHLGNPKKCESDQSKTNTEIESPDKNELDKPETKDEIITNGNNDQILKSNNENSDTSNSSNDSPKQDETFDK